MAGGRRTFELDERFPLWQQSVEHLAQCPNATVKLGRLTLPLHHPVVFCDLAGSTRFAEQADAESRREVMGRYHAMARHVAEEHGGTVATFIGDGVMATYGLPEVAEDDALRAVRTGLAPQRPFSPITQSMAAAHGVDLSLRVGINSGQVAVGADDADSTVSPTAMPVTWGCSWS